MIIGRPPLRGTCISNVGAAPLMRSLHGAVSSAGVASKTVLTSHGERTVRERKVRCAFRQDVVGLAP
jgi:hypothetical protein